MDNETPHIIDSTHMLVNEKVRYRLVWNHARRLNKRGEGLVQIECQQGRRRRYVSTHTYLRPEYWQDGQVTGTADDAARNYALRRMMWEVELVELEFLKRGMHVALPAMIDAVRQNVNPAAKLRDFIEAMLQDGERKPSTVQNYRTMMNDIDRFRTNTYLNDIDPQWVQKYEQYLRDSGVKHNTRVSRLRLLRAVVNEAMRRDLISQDPYRRMKMEKMEAHRGHLTFQQLHRLERMPLTGKDDLVRDLFLTGCYTGLRFSDIRTLRQEDIGQDGWLRKTMQKTGGEVEIPVDRLFQGKMMQIVRKYGGDIGRMTERMPTNSDANRTLKRLLREVKADGGLTFHSSRHTFATLLSKQGMPTASIQRLLGHSDLAMTMIYNEATAAEGRREIEAGLRRLNKKQTSQQKQP